MTSEAEIFEKARLRWLARRGMLELDVWLTRFLDSQFDALDVAEQRRFVYLLQQDDMTLFDWLTGHAVPPEELAPVLNAIRTVSAP